MPDAILVALIATLTAIVVATITPWVARRVEAGRERRSAVAAVNAKYLAPLRHQIAEAVFRNREVADRARARQVEALDCLDNLEEIRGKDLRWFTSNGCYLMSTVYIVACLFAQLSLLQQAYPFLQLRKRDRDTELSGLVLRVNIAFLRGYGVYYALQYAIGQDMIRPDGSIASYPEFCARVQDPEHGVWYERLIDIYRGLPHGEGIERIENAVDAMRQLSLLLDAALGGAASVTARLQIEMERQTPDRVHRSNA